MLFVGLTGGIGAGKSVVARMLAERGAVVFDADRLAREAVAPGSPGFARVVERFGEEILAGGDIDRQALAARVFGDEAARRDLESVIHPEVFRLLSEGVERYRGTDAVVVFDAPLIVETGFDRAVDTLVVVTSSEAERVERLMASRGMTDEEARTRIAAQMPAEEKEARAQHVVRNDGSLADLEAEVDRLWRALSTRARTT